MPVPAPINIALMAESKDSLLAVSFVKNRSYKYAPAVAIAQTASRYHEEPIDKSIVHYAVFSRGQEDAARALCLVDHAAGWPSTQIYGGGQLVQNRHHVKSVLRCYLNSCACADPRAYCCYVYRWASFKDGSRLLLPCKLLEMQFKYDPNHPSKPGDQMQACAVKRGVNWCPSLNYEYFRKV